MREHENKTQLEKKTQSGLFILVPEVLLYIYESDLKASSKKYLE